MTDEPETEPFKTLLALENQVWTALTTGDAAVDTALLSADFLGVYADGFADRAAHVGQLDQGPTVREYRLSDPRLRLLGTDHAVLSYRADFQRNSKEVAETMYVSSIWHHTRDGWINVFSQDTPAEET